MFRSQIRFAIVLMAVFTIMFGLLGVASAQCANGNCSSRNATLGESAATIAAPVFAPAPAPQIAYYTAPGGASAASATAVAGAPAPTAGQLVVAGYTAPQVAMQTAPVVAYYTAPAPAGASASASTSVATAPALIGASQVACSNGGCGGRRFAPFQGIRARRGGSFAKSVSITRS